MNILGLVFSLLLILSYGFYASWDKQIASSRLRSTYIHHQKANRKILNSYQSQIYSGLSVKTKEKTDTETIFRVKKTKKSEEKKEVPFNRACAKLNLWPLIQEGREKHPLLYSLAARLIHTFYGSLSQEKQFEYAFLDALLASAKKAIQEKDPFSLEKLPLPEYQKLYYKMLKGTKSWDLRLGKGYPSLLDYMKAESSNDKICLFHAHPDMLTILFNEQIAAKLYSAVHRKEGPFLTQDLVERICAETHLVAIDPDLLILLEFGKPNHEDLKQVFIAQEKDVSLRRNLSINAEGTKRS